MEIEILQDGVVVGLNDMLDNGKSALAELWAVNADPVAVGKLQRVTTCLEQTISVLKTCLKMMIEKDICIREFATERDEIATAYHDRTAIIDEQSRQIEELQAGLAEWQRWYQEQHHDANME